MTVKFVKRTPDEIDNSRVGPRGRVSYPILKSFMETGYYIAELDLSESNRKPPQMYALLTSYVKTHNMPIKPFMRGGKMHLMRLDIDEKGNKIENWQAEQDMEDNAAEDAPPINPKDL